MPEPYFTVPFELGQVVVHLNARGDVTSIGFDLEGRCEQRRTDSELGTALARYFQGEEVTWPGELRLDGLTGFRRTVYATVSGVPYGQTASYGEIAARAGCPGGARAVGQAMGSNRFPLVVPCHRVVGSNGALGGFSSGVALKRYLLDLEGIDL